ncbi:anti-anti-sigma factor [Catenulispora sp. GP43]|uniref:STAS domain-containing protein n=1 Tax=Catenulispora sp. GP43 TaxID=3156263 RepID=UPI003511D73C
MGFSCTTRKIAGRVVLIVAGDVDLAAHSRFETDVEQYWDGSTDLVLDCSQVTFLDSMGLRVLVQAVQRPSEKGRGVALAAPSTPVLRVLELAGVKDLFSLEGPISDADADAAL